MFIKYLRNASYVFKKCYEKFRKVTKRRSLSKRVTFNSSLYIDV